MLASFRRQTRTERALPLFHRETLPTSTCLEEILSMLSNHSIRSILSQQQESLKDMKNEDFSTEDSQSAFFRRLHACLLCSCSLFQAKSQTRKTSNIHVCTLHANYLFIRRHISKLTFRSSEGKFSFLITEVVLDIHCTGKSL